MACPCNFLLFFFSFFYMFRRKERIERKKRAAEVKLVDVTEQISPIHLRLGRIRIFFRPIKFNFGRFYYFFGPIHQSNLELPFFFIHTLYIFTTNNTF